MLGFILTLYRNETVMGQTVVIYDGLCGLCQSSVKLLRRLDWLHRLTFRDAHSEAVREDYPDLSLDDLMGEIHVVTADGRVLTGYKGVREQIRHLPLVAWLYPLLFLPGIKRIGPRIYGWIARNRYRINRLFGMPLPCDGETCSVHPS